MGFPALLVLKVYLVWLDILGTYLNPTRHQYFHSNHPVWSGLAEACHTATTNIWVKSVQQVWRLTSLCMHACLCVSVCELARVLLRLCQSVRKYLSQRTGWTRHIWDYLAGEGRKHWVWRPTRNLLACLTWSTGLIVSEESYQSVLNGFLANLDKREENFSVFSL